MYQLRLLRTTESLGEQYLLYRWGGEEFLLVCLEQTALQCNESIDNFYLAMDQSLWPKALKVTASTGITQLKECESIRTAIKRADKALYQAKDNGRNQVVTFY